MTSRRTPGAAFARSGPAAPTTAAAGSESRVLELLGGKWLAAAVAAAAELGLADVLAEESLTVEALAERLGCDLGALRRLLPVLVGEELLAVDAERCYALTAAGEQLREEAFGPLARFVGASFSWEPWAQLAQSVESGRSAFELRHGKGLFDYLDQHPAEAELYHAAIDAFVGREARDVAEAFDFSGVRRVADLGGGRGGLLVEVLLRWPHLEGVLLERPAAVSEARAAFADAGIDGRCEAREGDFFVALPERVDLCILKHVIHSWDDEVAIDLLRRCAERVGPTGHVLVIEGLRLPEGRLDQTGLLDLEMLVLCGPGHERSKPEMRRLFARAGLRLVRAPAIAGGARMLVTQPVQDRSA